MISWALFYNPMTLGFHSELWLVLPLCAAVGLVYKTIRVHDLRHLPRDVLVLMVYMVAGLVFLAMALWGIHEYWP